MSALMYLRSSILAFKGKMVLPGRAIVAYEAGEHANMAARRNRQISWSVVTLAVTEEIGTGKLIPRTRPAISLDLLDPAARANCPKDIELASPGCRVYQTLSPAMVGFMANGGDPMRGQFFRELRNDDSVSGGTKLHEILEPWDRLRELLPASWGSRPIPADWPYRIRFDHPLSGRKHNMPSFWLGISAAQSRSLPADQQWHIHPVDGPRGFFRPVVPFDLCAAGLEDLRYVWPTPVKLEELGAAVTQEVARRHTTGNKHTLTVYVGWASKGPGPGPTTADPDRLPHVWGEVVPEVSEYDPDPERQFMATIGWQKTEQQAVLRRIEKLHTPRGSIGAGILGVPT